MEPRKHRTAGNVGSAVIERYVDPARRRDGDRRLRVLVLARNYPNSALPLLGLWTDETVRCTTAFADVKVISPVPYAPPRAPAAYARFRGVPRSCWRDGVEVFHPRMLVGPGNTTHDVESIAYAAAVAPTARRLRA